MLIEGLTVYQIQDIAASLGLATENVHPVGRKVSVRVLPISSSDKYARRTISGRRIRAACYHGFRDFCISAFTAGATGITTAANPDDRSRKATYRSLQQFTDALYDLYDLNVGNNYRPVAMGSLCDCRTAWSNDITGAVIASNTWREPVAVTA